MADLAEIFADALHNLLDQGFEYPLYFAAIARNGSMLMAQYDVTSESERLTCTPVAERVIDDNYALPINIMFTDRRGEAARVMIDQSGEQIVYH